MVAAAALRAVVGMDCSPTISAKTATRMARPVDLLATVLNAAFAPAHRDQPR